MKIPKPRQFPKELTINGITWKVIFVDQIAGKHCLGLCDSETKTIQIKRRLAPKLRLDTFIHECIHALEYSIGFDANHSHVDKIASGLADLLIVNF